MRSCRERCVRCCSTARCASSACALVERPVETIVWIDTARSHGSRWQAARRAPGGHCTLRERCALLSLHHVGLAVRSSAPRPSARSLMYTFVALCPHTRYTRVHGRVSRVG